MPVRRDGNAAEAMGIVSSVERAKDMVAVRRQIERMDGGLVLLETIPTAVTAKPQILTQWAIPRSGPPSIGRAMRGDGS